MKGDHGAVDPSGEGDQVGGALRAHDRSGRDAGGPAPPDRHAPLVAGGRIRVLRRDLRCPRARGRRVLRRSHAGDGDRGRGGRHAPGIRRHALEPADVPLRPRPVARGARRGPGRRQGEQRPEPRLVPHVQQRRDLDAGQVGVPLVRRLGPGLSRDHAGRGGPRLRHAAARAHAGGALRPSERADPRVRVELQRREPAGARVGDAVQLPPAAEPLRRARPAESSSARSTSSCSTSRGG